MGLRPRPNFAMSAADDEPGRRDAEDDAPPLDREQRKAVGIHQRHVDAADEVVEASRR